MLRSLIPWRETLPRSFSRFEDEMDQMLENFFGRGERNWGGENFVPTANLVETENEFEVTIDLPGLKPEEVNLELREGALWITGERKEETEEKGKTFHRMERRYGSFRRVIPLPTSVKDENIEAEFRQGVMTVKLPTSEEIKLKPGRSFGYIYDLDDPSEYSVEVVSVERAGKVPGEPRIVATTTSRVSSAESRNPDRSSSSVSRPTSGISSSGRTVAEDDRHQGHDD